MSAVRSHGCKLFPVLFAAMALSTLQVNPPPQMDGLTVPVLFTPVNLRGKGILVREDDVLSALGCNTIVANLDTVAGKRGVEHQDEILWDIAREIGAQIEEQTNDTKCIGIWSHDYICAMRRMLIDKGKSSGNG